MTRITNFWKVFLVQLQFFGPGTRNGLEILYKCCKKFKTKSLKVLFWELILTFVEVTREKISRGTSPPPLSPPRPLYLSWMRLKCMEPNQCINNIWFNISGSGWWFNGKYHLLLLIIFLHVTVLLFQYFLGKLSKNALE